MTKKKNPPGKIQRDRMKAKKLREEGAAKLRQHVEPKKQAHVDEKGRKLTVVLGGEAVWSNPSPHSFVSLRCHTPHR
ncbi:hypothetical protein CTA1_9671 [Colletotrichum tanaceti]|uniref:Uncharacterized protein n=1 Tax=Colletotrichum tanaceti TaxID=1306861 RepID=A0A4U6XF85_9PEZI|nr:hypothetical protein CTA1_9671 [Colletotrichum tanaceti]